MLDKLSGRRAALALYCSHQRNAGPSSASAGQGGRRDKQPATPFRTLWRERPPFAERLPDYGANAAWFHEFDAQAYATCERHGLAPCVEFKTFRADFGEHPELVPIGVDGQPIRYGRLVQGICLSQTGFVQEAMERLARGMSRYQPTGVWLDYMTYAGWFETPNPDLQESCFCPGCIRTFCEASDVDATSPEEILSRHAAAWHQHKRERIAGYAAQFAAIIRAARPHCLIGAYMCPWTPEEYGGALGDIFAQDYALLAPSIDVFTPLIYAAKSGRSMDWGRRWLEGAQRFVPSDRRVQLILDALDGPESMIETARSPHPTWGFQLFGGAKIFADDARATVFRQTVDIIRERI